MLLYYIYGLAVGALIGVILIRNKKSLFGSLQKK